MKKLIVGLILVILLVPVSCAAPPSPDPAPMPAPAPTPKTTKVIPEEGDKGTIVSGSFPAFTIEDCIEHSDAIVIGKVTEILPAKWGKNPMGDIIYQDVIVQTERYLYGEPESEFIAVCVWGGKVGDTYMVMDSDPVFTVGEKTLLFLHRPPKEFMATVPEGIDPRSYYRVTASIPGKHEFKDGILTDYRGQTTNISTVEEKIAASSPGYPNHGITATRATPEPGDNITKSSALMIKLTMDDLIEKSDAIAIGKVVDIFPSRKVDWEPMDINTDVVEPWDMITDVVIEVERYLYGQPRSSYIVGRAEFMLSAGLCEVSELKIRIKPNLDSHAL